MTTYVEPANARLGDVVQDMVGFGVVTGKIVGVDTQGPAILVRWHDVQKRAMDVYSVDSPVWSCFGIVRPVTLTAIALDVPLVTQCPDCGADVPTIFEHVGGCPEQPASTWPSNADGLTVDGRHPDLEQFTCNHDGVNTESLAEQEVLAQHGFAVVPLAAPGSAFNVLPDGETVNYVAEGIGLQQACTVCRNHTECDGSCQHPEPAVIKLPWG